MSRLLRADRRRLLQGALAGAASTFLPLRSIAQAPGQAGTAVLGAPRYALVIGNERYQDSPLKNPVNDARAIAEELRAADFSVSLVLDASLEAMRARVDAFGVQIARSKAVGLFYFAGHAVQLSWRNYLLPIDTMIAKAEEVPGKAVDLGRLLENMRRAGNPANIVILDACRNNPFGRDFRLEHKGLSQVDAPVGTLLAYATAPGNVAIDGEGANGLYTEHLLKEIRVPDAKVEDIFKRVRLAVRRRSKGLQIPWESTSLEDDFYFQLPEELRKAAEVERARRVEAEREARRLYAEREREIEAQLRQKQLAEAQLQLRLQEERDALRRAEETRQRKEDEERAARQHADAQRRRMLEAQREARRRDEAERVRVYEEQLAIWERIKGAGERAPLEAFLYRFPGGHFSELAQLRLDQLLVREGERRIEAVNAPQNPYTRGTARADTAYKLGDNYVYRVIDRYTGNELRQLNQTVTAISAGEVSFNDGQLVLDPLGNLVQLPDGRRFTGRQDQPLEYALGKRWSTRFGIARGGAQMASTEFEFRIVDREKVTVPAGTFDCFKVEGSGSGLTEAGMQLVLGYNYWIAPDRVRRPVVIENQRRVEGGRKGRVLNAERLELVSFRQG